MSIRKGVWAAAALLAGSAVPSFAGAGQRGLGCFRTDSFSMQATHGARYTSVDSDQNGEFTMFASEDPGISSSGFHGYFVGK